MARNLFGQGGREAANVNHQLIRPLVDQNLPILVLFLLPAVTMRTYSEEKRSGTIELLLTSPLTDFEIVMGKFLGTLGLYCAMLAVTVFPLGVLFVGGRPEWRPLPTPYLGFVPCRSRFLSLGLFI